MDPALLVGTNSFAAWARRHFPIWAVRLEAYLFRLTVPPFPDSRSPLARRSKAGRFAPRTSRFTRDGGQSLSRNSASPIKPLAALLFAVLTPLLAENEKSKSFELPLTRVWTAAVDVGRSDFALETVQKDRGILTFRAGPKTGFAFRYDVFIRAVNPNRTVVTLRIRNRNVELPALQKAVWRSGDKFFANLHSRLAEAGERK